MSILLGIVLALTLQNSDPAKLITQMARVEKLKSARVFPPTKNALSLILDVSFLLVFLTFVPPELQDGENFLKWEEPVGPQPHYWNHRLVKRNKQLNLLLSQFIN